MKDRQNVVLQQGDDETIVAPVEDGDDPNNDYISDLSTYTFSYELATRKAGGTVVLDETDLTISTDTASNITSGALDDTGVGDSDDVILVEFTASDTDSLDEDTYWHRLKMTDGTGTTQTVLRGKVSVSL